MKEAAGKYNDDRLAALASVRIDDLSTAAIVRHLVNEYTSKMMLQESLKVTLKRAPAAQRAEEGSQSSQGAGGTSFRSAPGPASSVYGQHHAEDEPLQERHASRGSPRKLVV